MCIVSVLITHDTQLHEMSSHCSPILTTYKPNFLNNDMSGHYVHSLKTWNSLKETHKRELENEKQTGSNVNSVWLVPLPLFHVRLKAWTYRECSHEQGASSWMIWMTCVWSLVTKMMTTSTSSLYVLCIAPRGILPLTLPFTADGIMVPLDSLSDEPDTPGDGHYSSPGQTIA